MKTRRLPIVLAILALGAAAAAQNPRFETGVTNVHVEAAVLRNQRPVTGLQPGDFVVRDDGEPREIVSFGEESVPLDLALLLDLGGTMNRDMAEVAKDARAALALLSPEDRVAVVAFSLDARLEQAPTRDAEAIRQAVLRVARRGPVSGIGTHLNSAVVYTSRMLWHPPGGAPPDATRRRAILVVTRNMALGSPSPDYGVIAELGEADAVLNAIVVRRKRIGYLNLPPLRDKPGDPRYEAENVFHLAGHEEIPPLPKREGQLRKPLCSN